VLVFSGEVLTVSFFSVPKNPSSIDMLIVASIFFPFFCSFCVIIFPFISSAALTTTFFASFPNPNIVFIISPTTTPES
jgi:hypothetical protein